MRVHELALQRWFYTNFFVQGAKYPIPVLFAPPRLAFSEFNQLWRTATNPDNPFHYLTMLKDAKGRPLYEPYPSNVRYPLVSIKRLGTRYRPNQSYAIHRYRRVSWPTVAADVVRQDLGMVAQAQMPSAWDYRYQVSFFCRQPQTLAYFNSRLHAAMKLAAADPQTYIVARYPHHHGPQYLRLVLDASIDDVQQDTHNEAYVEYQTSFNLTLEGYHVCYDLKYVPAFWRLVAGMSVVAPDTLASLYDFRDASLSRDLRDEAINPVLDSAINVPAAGTNVSSAGTNIS